MNQGKQKTSFTGFLLRIMIPAATTIGLFVAATFLFFIPTFEETLLSEKRRTVNEHTTIAWNILQSCHQEEVAGRLDTKAAQAMAIKLISAIRYGPEEKDYFWVNDMHPRMVFHPYRPELNGTDLSTYEDKQGKLLFKEFVRVVTEDDSGFVDYMWQWKDDPERIVAKLSFVKGFKPWGWVIGTGIYIEDVQEEIGAIKKNIISVFLSTLAIISVLIFLMFCQSMIAAEKKMTADARVKNINVLLKAIRTVGHLDNNKKSTPDELLQKACESLVETRGFRQAWIALLDPDQKLVTVAEVGHNDLFPRILPGLKEGQIPGICQQSLQDQEVVISNDTTATCRDCPLCQEHANDAAMAVRLKHGSRIYGFLNTTATVDIAQDQEEQDLLLEIADDLAFALHTIEQGEMGIKSQTAFLESQEKFNQAFSASQEGMCLSRLDDGVILEVNAAFLQVINGDRDQVVGKSIVELEAWANKKEQQQFLKILEQNDELRDFDMALRTLDGTVIPALISARIIKMEGERRVISILRDLSATKKIEEELRLSEVRYQSLFTSMLDGFALCEIMCDQDQKPIDFMFLEINTAFEKITGHSREQVIGQRARKIFPNLDDELVTAFGEVALAGQTMDAEYHFADLDKNLEIVAFLHQKRQFAFSFKDTAERKAAEDERLRLQDHLQKMQKLESLGLMASRMAHDFNNVLMGISGNAELAQEELPPDSEIQVRVKEIENGARKASLLCNQLLTFSGKAETKMVPLSGNEVIKDIYHLLEVSISKMTTMSAEFDPDLPYVLADPGQLRQLFMNLVTNAAASLGPTKGKISIKTGLLTLSAEDLAANTHAADALPGEYVYFAVQDTGKGMDKATQTRIFDPYYSTTSNGRGLGLAAVSGIVRSHGGVIMVESAPEQGTTMTICLPPTAKRPARPTPIAEPPPPDWTGQGTVLLADDDKTVVAVTKVMLKKLGLQVLTAANGQEAVATYASESASISLVLLDMSMPEMSGREALAEIRKIKPDARVILSSGYDEEEALDHIPRDEHLSFIHKPYKFDKLRRKIQECLRP